MARVLYSKLTTGEELPGLPGRPHCTSAPLIQIQTRASLVAPWLAGLHICAHQTNKNKAVSRQRTRPRSCLRPPGCFHRLVSSQSGVHSPHHLQCLRGSVCPSPRLASFHVASILPSTRAVDCLTLAVCSSRRPTLPLTQLSPFSRELQARSAQCAAYCHCGLIQLMMACVIGMCTEACLRNVHAGKTRS